MPLIRLYSSIKKRSISRIMYLGLSLIISLLLLFAYDTQQRLNLFYDTLELLSEESLVTAIESGKISNQVNTLLSHTNQLLYADSNPLRHSEYKKIEHQLQILATLTEQKIENDYAKLQLKTLSNELELMNALVRDKLNIDKQLQENFNQIYTLYWRLNINEHNKASLLWQKQLADILLLATQASLAEHFYLLDQGFNKALYYSQQIETNLQLFNSSITEQQKPVLIELLALILNRSDGVFATKRQQLQLFGRARGSANMVRNLIKDYARLTEFESHQLNQQILNNAKKSKTEIREHISTIKFVYALSIISILFFSLFISRYVVARLISLKNQVKERISGKNQLISIKGNDELTELANTFESFATTIEQQNSKLERLSIIDPLTNIANRRALDERIKHEINIAAREKWPISLLMIDIDFFKQYNDNYGHTLGDTCLKKTAKLLKSLSNRKTDFIARFGGEEFVYLLPNTDIESAKQFADMLQVGFNQANIIHEFSDIAQHLTISIGIYTELNVEEKSVDRIFDFADKALYEAKQTGRNKWVYYTGPTS